MPVARPRTRLAGGIAVIAVAAAVALPAGASAASSGTASAASGDPVAVASATKGRKKCRGNKVAVRKRGKVRCVRKRRAGGDALRDGGSRQTAPTAGGQPAEAPTAPAEQPALPEQVQSTDPPAEPPANQSQRADWVIVDSNGNPADLNALYPAYTTVGGAPTYYRQSCTGWWWEYGYAIRRCVSGSNRTGHYRFEWDYWNGTYWVTYATTECVYGVCG